MAEKGRPPEPFDQVVADAICELLIQGWSLRRVLAEGSGVIEDDDGKEIQMPTVRVFYRWIREQEDFRKQYAQAKEEATDAQFEELATMGDEAIELARNAPDPKIANALVTAVRLKSDNLKWQMSKMKAKKYGDKLDLTSDGKRIEQSPVIISTIQPRDNESESTKSG